MNKKDNSDVPKPKHLLTSALCTLIFLYKKIHSLHKAELTFRSHGLKPERN